VGDTVFPVYTKDNWDMFFSDKLDGFRYETWKRKKG
jgi:hypothetical protein